MTTYEINTADKSYTTISAAKAADMAVALKNQGQNPAAYVIGEDETGIVTAQSPITTKKATATALSSAAAALGRKGD